MTQQYVVVFLPTGDLNAQAVGPFRSKAKAQAVSDRLYDALERPDVGVIPQVVRLMTEQAAVDEYQLP